MPQTARIVSHDVGVAGDVIMRSNIAMLALVQGIEAEEISTCRRGGGRAFVGPGQGSAVICCDPQGALHHWSRAGEDVFVRNDGRQF
jgi:hypothetical protein